MPWPKKILFSLLPAVLFFGLLEMVLHAMGFTYEPKQRVLWKPTVAEFVRTVEVYHPTEFDPPGYLWLRRDNIAGRNPDGSFRYRWPATENPDKVRVAFLGGSTSEAGGDYPFPDRCIDLLNTAAGSNRFEGVNVACSSYNTHQSVMALERYALPGEPDVVVVYHGWNDAGLMSDGFADKEKDSLLKDRSSEQAVGRFAALARLKTTQLVGMIQNRLAGGWPRPRVSPKDFEANLHAIVERCGERGIPVVMVKRPVSLTPPVYPYPPEYVACYAPRFGTNRMDIYQAQYDLYAPIQEEVARAYEHVRLAPADDYLVAAQQRLAPNTNVSVFVQDACHCTGLGYQFLAEVVAQSVAPDMAARVASYVESADYWKGLARLSLDMEYIHEAVYAAREAMKRDPAWSEEGNRIIDEAERLVPFYELFDRGKWSGEAKPTWPEQVATLLQCLEIRPDDLGVAIQIFRVCVYNGRPDAAAEPLMAYQPGTTEERYEWLKLLLQSHMSGRRAGPAYETAEAILAINPNDQNARGVLTMIQRQE